MGFVIVWGTKVREVQQGSAGFPCPWCGEVTLGDCVLVEQASHVYFIRGRFNEVGRYMRCRLCANAMDVQASDVHPRTVPEDVVWPSRELLQETNPLLAAAPAQWTPNEVEIPPGSNRRQWAFLAGLEGAMHREGAQDRVGGNTFCFIFFLAVPCVGSLAYIVLEVPDGSRWPWLILWAVGTLLSGYLLYRLHWWMVFRSTYRRYGAHLVRHLKATMIPLGALQCAAESMGSAGRYAARFLRWAARRV